MNWRHPLFRWFVFWLMGMIAIIAVLSKDHYPLKSDQPAFHTTEQATLYFKNMRSYFYYSYEDPASSFVLYRWKKWEYRWRGEAPAVAWVLVENWQLDETYITAQLNRAASDAGFDRLVLDWGIGGSDTLDLETANALEQDALATQLYDLLGEADAPDSTPLKFKLMGPEAVQTLDVFEDPRDRNTLKIILDDYFRWTGRK